MKEVLKKFVKGCKNSILFYTFAYAILFIVSKLILNAIGMEYRSYVNYSSIILILIGVITGVTQILNNIKMGVIKICLIICNISIMGFVIICSPIILLFVAFLPPEHVVIKNNKTYVAYVYSWLDTRVEYYDYVNFFLMGNTKRMEDFYNNVGRDVLAKDAEGLFTPSYTTYYDKYGKYQYNISNKENNIKEIKNSNETIYSSEQLKKYEKDFNTLAINGFIISTNAYTKPSEIDLGQVFYNGAGFNNEISKEEVEEYKKLRKYHETDIVKITTKQAEKLYYDNTGEKLEDLKGRLKNWIYIEKYDAYYNEVSDTNFEKVNCIKGIMDEQNKIMKIQLSNDRTISVKIDYDKGTHYIVSNNSIKSIDNEANNNYQEYMEEQDKIIIPNSSDDILYKKEINENTIIRVRNLGAILAQRSVINIEKSTDVGKTYIGQTKEGITIHNGAKFTFIDENVGFINDPGLAGTDGENKGFLVTTDGGKTFKDTNIVHPYSIEEINLLVKGVPYIEDGKLKVVIYTLNHSKSPERTYYEFVSKDNGITWFMDKMQ